MKIYLITLLGLSCGAVATDISSCFNRVLRDPEYGTHMEPLLTVAAHTSGPILELGCGDYSTPLLHALCKKEQRKLVSVDTDKKWLSYFLDLERAWHTFLYVPVYEDDWSVNPKPYLWDYVGKNVQWSVVLIDHRPGERRVEDIARLRPETDIFVVHDTNQPTYNYEQLLSTFRYKYVYRRYSIQTTVVSDTIDVTQFFSN
jgi:hypothetical protein